jgi:hypothetical protein
MAAIGETVTIAHGACPEQPALTLCEHEPATHQRMGDPTA